MYMHEMTSIFHELRYSQLFMSHFLKDWDECTRMTMARARRLVVGNLDTYQAGTI